MSKEEETPRVCVCGGGGGESARARERALGRIVEATWIAGQGPGDA
jgi:hypothetical protein